MALSRLAAEFAAEIKLHDWSDAPWRADRAGHRREHDSNIGVTPQLPPVETDTIRLNVMWVTAQVLAHADPNLDVYEFAEACGVDTRTPTGRPRSGHIPYGLRGNPISGYAAPGSLEWPT